MEVGAAVGVFAIGVALLLDGYWLLAWMSACLENTSE
jgi:hypothetical protein